MLMPGTLKGVIDTRSLPEPPKPADPKGPRPPDRREGVSWFIDDDRALQHPMLAPFRAWKQQGNVNFIRYPRKAWKYWEVAPRPDGETTIVYYDDADDPDELEQVLDLVTVNAAKALRLEAYGTSVGDRADLVVLGVPSVREALRLLPPRKYVLRAGEVVAGTAAPVS